MDIEKFQIDEDTAKAIFFMYYGVLWSNKHGNALAKRQAFRVLKSISEIKLKHQKDDIDDYLEFVDTDIMQIKKV